MRPAPVLFAVAGAAAATLLVKSRRKRRGEKLLSPKIVEPVAVEQLHASLSPASSAPLEKTAGRAGEDHRSESAAILNDVEILVETQKYAEHKGGSEISGGGARVERLGVVGHTAIVEPYERAPSDDYQRYKTKAAQRQEAIARPKTVELEEIDEEEVDFWKGYEIEATRTLGAIEENWVRAAPSGTGVSVLMIVIARQVAGWQVTYAGRELQRRHAMLRTWIVSDRDGKPRFEVSKHPFLETGVEYVRPIAGGGLEIAPSPGGVQVAVLAEEGGGEIPDWQQVLERELNTPIAKAVIPPGTFVEGVDSCEERFPGLALKLHFLPGGRCSVAVRVHTATCDYAAVALAAGEFVNLLDQVVGQTDEQTLSGGSLSPPRGMKRVFSNAGLHHDDEWLIEEQCENVPERVKMRRAFSSHKLHRNHSADRLVGGGIRKVQSAVHLDRGGFGSFTYPGGFSAVADGANDVFESQREVTTGLENGNGNVVSETLPASKPRSESPSSCLQGPMSSSTSASSLSPDPDSHVAAAHSFSRVPTEDGKALYDVSELPPLRPLRKRPPQDELTAPASPDDGSSPLSPSFSSPMSFVSAHSHPISPWSSPPLSRSPSLDLVPSGGDGLASPAPPPSPLSSSESPCAQAAMGLIDPFAKLGDRTIASENNSLSHAPDTTLSNCTIDAPLLGTNKKPASVHIGPLEYIKGGSGPLPCMEDLVDKNRAKKPFWAKGKDLVAYSVGSLGKPLLGFQPGWAMPLRSQIVYASIPQAATQALLAACADRNTSLYGALSAASFLAVAASKKTGPCPETYGITTMVNCRAELRGPLRDTDLGFFHSAMMHHHHVAETTEFWELAGRCSGTLEKALQEDKHFKDMGVLNLLFHQAMQHPNLTPQSSMRTSVLCAFSSSVHVPLPTTSTLKLTDIIGCASVHGVGPCIGIFSFMINGNLHYCLAYPAPLFSREQVSWINERMRELLVSCTDDA